MAFDPILGMFQGTGNQLSLVPAEATRDQQVAAINEVVKVLNNYSRDVVGSASVTMVIPPATNDLVLTIPHNLGYKPRANVYLNNVTLSINGNAYPAVDIPLPTYLSSFIPSGFGGGGGGLGIQFTTWLDFFADTVNLYVHLQNPLNLSGTLPLTYELRRQASS